MAQVMQVSTSPNRYAAPLPSGFAAAINRQKFRLLSNLSGSRSYYGAQEAKLPTSMTEPVSFDGSADEDGLTAIELVAIDESEDSW